MLELVPPGLNIDFISKAKMCITISVVVILDWPGIDCVPRGI